MPLPAPTNCTADDKLTGLATFLTVRYDFGGQLFSSRVRCCITTDEPAQCLAPLDT